MQAERRRKIIFKNILRTLDRKLFFFYLVAYHSNVSLVRVSIHIINFIQKHNQTKLMPTNSQLSLHTVFKKRAIGVHYWITNLLKLKIIAPQKVLKTSSKNWWFHRCFIKLPITLRQSNCIGKSRCCKLLFRLGTFKLLPNSYFAFPTLKRKHTSCGGEPSKAAAAYLSEPTSLNILVLSWISCVTSLLLKLLPCIPCLWKASTLSVKHTKNKILLL